MSAGVELVMPAVESKAVRPGCIGDDTGDGRIEHGLGAGWDRTDRGQGGDDAGQTTTARCVGTAERDAGDLVELTAP